MEIQGGILEFLCWRTVAKVVTKEVTILGTKLVSL